MKCILFIVTLLFSLRLNAQTKELSTQSFVTALNNLVTHTTSQHWAYDTPFTVDSPFHLYGDTLTATFRYQTDTSFFRVRYAASIRKIRSIDHDVYLMMVFKANEVQLYQQVGEGPWEYSGNTNLLHIGMVETKQLPLKAAIEQAWEKLKAWYK